MGRGLLLVFSYYACFGLNWSMDSVVIHIEKEGFIFVLLDESNSLLSFAV